MRRRNTKRTRSKKVYRKHRKNRGQKRQRGGFLNHYDFAYAGRDTVNQAAKVSPGVVNVATNDISKIAEQRINQIISQGGKEMERVLPKILWGAIQDVYHMSFRLLSNFGKQELNKITRKKMR